MVHDDYYMWFRTLNVIVSVLLIVLNATISGLVFSGDNGPTGRGGEPTIASELITTITGPLSVFVTCLTAINSRMKLGELVEGHINAKRAFVRLKRRMDVLRDIRKLALVVPADTTDPKLTPGQVHPEWEALIDDWDTAAGDAPPVSMKYTRKLFRKFEKSARDELEKEIGM